MCTKAVWNVIVLGKSEGTICIERETLSNISLGDWFGYTLVEAFQNILP